MTALKPMSEAPDGVALRPDQVPAWNRRAVPEAVKEMRETLVQCREACLFVDEDGQIGVSEDAVIPTDLFNRICNSLKAVRELGDREDG